MSKIPALTFYEYAAQHGWHPFQPLYEPRPWIDGYSKHDVSWAYADSRRAHETDNWLKRRSELYAQYVEHVSAGRLRHPTRMEMLRAAANGHPDNESTQAARRVLRRMSRAARAMAICCPSQEET